MPFVKDPFNGCAKEIARDKVFRQLEREMYLWEICQIVGKPDEDVGSGIYAYVYRMDNGSVVMVTFANPYLPASVELQENQRKVKPQKNHQAISANSQH